MAAKGIALVTGASRGIGRAIALRLAHDGFDLAINDLPRSKDTLEVLRGEIQRKGRRALSVVGDVSVEKDVQNIFSSVVGEYGGLDAMVANAGILLARPVVETTVEEWDRIFSINARGVFMCYKYAGQQMVKQGRGGRIIGASSAAGKQGAVMLGAYSAAKFAVRGLTQSTALELGTNGITVNAYAPGAIETPLLHDFIADPVKLEELKAEEAKLAAVGHIGQPEDIASIVSYLVSKEAHFITGQTISVNGGRFFD